jgi:hypothetical protein
MNRRTWKAFAAARERYRGLVEHLRHDLPGLEAAEQRLVSRRSGPPYRVETPVVYNEALDDVGPGDTIKLILVADNPGRREQAAENRRYLVGPSGKIAEKFFRDTPELDIDFRRQVIILNKTPIHTPRTAELRELGRLGGAETAGAIIRSQQAMASLLAEFHRALYSDTKTPVWIVGYSEMGKGGLFEEYTRHIQGLYGHGGAIKDSLFLYRHFSMNQFTIDLRRQITAGETAGAALDRIGRVYRGRILGW